MEEKNDRLKGILGALLVLLLLFTLSLFLGMYYPDPPIPDEGVEIEMGGSGSKGGESGQTTTAETNPVPVPTSSTVSQTYVTQSNPDVPSVPSGTQTKKQVKETQQQNETVNQRQPNQKAMFPTKKNSGSDGGGSGGNQSGNGDGNDKGDGSGGGKGLGSGPSFSLSGRTALSLPKPIYDCNAQGTIVIDVVVNQSGKVISAKYSTKSKSLDPCLKRRAIQAAKSSKFDVDINAAVEQHGTITYQFISN